MSKRFMLFAAALAILTAWIAYLAMGAAWGGEWQACWRWNTTYVAAFNPPEGDAITCFGPEGSRAGLVVFDGERAMLTDYISSDAGWVSLTVGATTYVGPITAHWYHSTPPTTEAIADDLEGMVKDEPSIPPIPSSTSRPPATSMPRWGGLRWATAI